MENAHIKDEAILSTPMDYYHDILPHTTINHADLWNKKNRILAYNDYKKILNSCLLQDLRDELGAIYITNEEKSGHGEIYWRLVRPPLTAEQDVGPVHADAWFWELGHGEMPTGYTRIKFWFAIYCERGQAGLGYIKDSHNHIYSYTSQEKGGILKPVFDAKKNGPIVTPCPTSPGDFVVFNDRLLHGGMLGGTKTRKSFQCDQAL